MSEHSRQTILVVDDAPENIDVLNGILRPDYQVRAALNGERALKVAASGNPPDLILLDIMMPEMDGYEVCRRLKGQVEARDIPVIFVSALDDVVDKVRGFEAGGVDYIAKPFQPKEVLARVDAHLTLHSLQEQLELRNGQLAQALVREKARLAERIESGLRAGNFAWWEMELPSGNVVFDDRKAGMLGYSPERFSSYADFTQLLHPDDHEDVMQAMRDHLSGRAKKYEVEYRIKTSDGTYRWLRDVGGITDQDETTGAVRVVGIVEDIATRKRGEERLETALAERETLLQELYHRTKNNMQVIIGLIDLQAAQTNAGQQLTAALKEVKDRIQSMALVHQKLYQSQNLSTVDLGEYIRDLTAMLSASYQGETRHITTEFSLEQVPVLIDTAVPCGLILNELLSNALKHAFPNGRRGKIRIHLERTETDRIMLQVSDNGVGLPPGFDYRQSDSMGMQTILGIGEYQMGASLSCKSADGVVWRMHFSDTLYSERV